MEDGLNKHAGYVGNAEFGAALAVNLDIAGALYLQLQVVKVELAQLRAFSTQLHEAFAADADARPDYEAGVAVLAHAEGLDGFAGIACFAAQHAQQTVGFEAGAGTEAAVCLPAHLTADIFADNVSRIRNADHNTLEVYSFEVADNLLCHFY